MALALRDEYLGESGIRKGMLREILLEWFPRKVTADSEYVAAIAPSISAYIDYLRAVSDSRAADILARDADMITLRSLVEWLGERREITKPEHMGYGLGRTIGHASGVLAAIYVDDTSVAELKELLFDLEREKPGQRPDGAPDRRVAGKCVGAGSARRFGNTRNRRSRRRARRLAEVARPVRGSSRDPDVDIGRRLGFAADGHGRPSGNW
jgi:hypothetical protein